MFLMLSTEWLSSLIGLVVTLIQITGVILAVKAVMISRTPQAAIGWALALVVLPYLAIPVFLIFGESRFSGYTMAGEDKHEALDKVLRETISALKPFRRKFEAQYVDAQNLAENLRGLPPVGGNSVKLLVDGEQTFPAIFEAIDSAAAYVIVQFYIINDDGLGRELKKRLAAAAARGVKCYVLYDGVGSKKLTREYIAEINEAGIEIAGFITNRQFGRRFQINFRNHRKLVIVDGRVGFIGGLNAGDEYLGKGPLGAWRDTHMSIEGPAVTALQVSFVEDWYYATNMIVDLPIQPRIGGHQVVLPYASGPAEPWSVTSAVICEILHDVKERVWIASPYFVPDPALRTALGHAALRGVDVRILLPQGIDHLLPWLSSFTNYPLMREAGVRIWRYQPGFMHQKVILADDNLASVGSVNLDFRSFMLNFELSGLVYDKDFAAEIEKMFEADFARSHEEDLDSFNNGPFWFRFKCRLASLMSPEQ